MSERETAAPAYRRLHYTPLLVVVVVVGVAAVFVGVIVQVVVVVVVAADVIKGISREVLVTDTGWIYVRMNGFSIVATSLPQTCFAWLA